MAFDAMQTPIEKYHFWKEKNSTKLHFIFNAAAQFGRTFSALRHFHSETRMIIKLITLQGISGITPGIEHVAVAPHGPHSVWWKIISTFHRFPSERFRITRRETQATGNPQTHKRFAKLENYRDFQVFFSTLLEITAIFNLKSCQLFHFIGQFSSDFIRIGCFRLNHDFNASNSAITINVNGSLKSGA